MIGGSGDLMASKTRVATPKKENVVESFGFPKTNKVARLSQVFLATFLPSSYFNQQLSCIS
ncbi:hypothetical protein CPC08DRAFT_24446 [Agrocybe pediades]|nr:hypothetical protein CPC08DRAFT_24446 [Agrocybe pediades]